VQTAHANIFRGPRSYTLESNYNAGRFANVLSAIASPHAHIRDGGATLGASNVIYDVSHWEECGRGIALSALDMIDRNPWLVGLVGWLVGLVGWLVGWLFGWLVGWLVGWFRVENQLNLYQTRSRIPNTEFRSLAGLRKAVAATITKGPRPRFVFSANTLDPFITLIHTYTQVFESACCAAPAQLK
jgi:hypothetical protein